MENYKQFSDEQIALANSIDLVEYLRNQGEALIKSGREFRWQRYTSVTVRDNRWFKHKTGEGGYPTQFLKEFYDYDFKQVMEILLSYANDTGQIINPELIKNNELKEFILPGKNETMKRVYAYLLKSRYIDKDVLNEFVSDGLIYEDKQYHNAVFVGTDIDGVARHAHKKATYTSKDGVSYRGNVEGSDPKYSFHYLGKSDKLYVFEAPIDMLSYISLHKENWQQHNYVALCGLGMQPIDYMLEENPQIEFIVAGTDHDIAGIEGAERIMDFTDAQCKIGMIVQPTYKDFNEDLKSQLGLEAVKGIDNPNFDDIRLAVKEVKESLSYQELQPIEHRELSKAFATMYYGLNHDGLQNYAQIKKDFIEITKCAWNLSMQQMSDASQFNGEEIDNLIDHYRSYQDKGKFNKRIERVKERFHDIKRAMDQQVSPEGLKSVYSKLATECATVVKLCNYELQQHQSQNVKNEMFQKPKAQLIGANGNIFNLMGIASTSLKENGLTDKAEEMFQKITSTAQSYEEALSILMEYVEPIEQLEECPSQGMMTQR